LTTSQFNILGEMLGIRTMNSYIMQAIKKNVFSLYIVRNFIISSVKIKILNIY